jgi:pyrrolidone-carboxylate peptidase
MMKALVAALALLAAQIPLTSQRAGGGCVRPAVPLSVEEQRLADGTTGPELVAGGGFAGLVAEFRATVCANGDAVAAGRQLWRAAVDRAQGRRDPGALDAADDRPLYWARLQMSAALRRSPGGTPAVLRAFDRASRGVGSAEPGVTALVSGFDPFGFFGDLRPSNPSGSAALQLDGRTLETPAGPVTVRAVVFPVTWGAFDEGIVEEAFGPALRDGPPVALVTISQGGSFAVEQWAAGWRTDHPDNADVSAPGPVPVAAGWPQAPETLIETTLPADRMAAVDPRVSVNPYYCVWPAGSAPGTGQRVCRYDGTPPLPGETGAAGGGGDFLSNESMYRANRLRLGLGATGVRGGHLHIPPVPLPADGALSDAASTDARRAITELTIRLVGAAAT